MAIPNQSSSPSLAGNPRQRAARGRARLLRGLRGVAHLGGILRGVRGIAPRAVLTWLCWWALLMALWVMLDDSFRADELVAGAVAAALAALLVTAVSVSAVKGGAVKGGAVKGGTAARAVVGTGWLREAMRLPWQVLRDTAAVYGALGRMARGAPPPGGYTEIPVRYGDGTTRGIIRRVLLTWTGSLAPNTFVVGMDPERDVMVIHRLAGIAHDDAPPDPRAGHGDEQ